MASRRVLDVLRESIRKEEEIHQFYADSAKFLRKSALASLFESIASEELEHKKMLELEFEAMETGGEEELPEEAAAEEPAEGGERLDWNQDEMKVARKAVKVFSDTAEQLLKKQLSYEQELTIAGEIQSNLLPATMPELEDLEISATVLMSRKVGGDYFDFHLNNKKQLFFVIGDVMGKGIPAALLMTSLRALWRNGALQNLSPRKIVEHMNAGSADDFRANGIFATLFSACYVPVKSSLWFCNAGHEPPFFIPRGRDESTFLTTPGVVIGINPNCDYKQKVQKLSSGDLILLYSDGLWEIKDPGQRGLYNKDRVGELLVENRERPTEEILSLLISKIKGLSGNIPQKDDLTLILIRRR